ncbi:hypothetical protein Tco_0345720 [Tanacetum coccineum]
MQTQEDHSNPIPALNVDSLKVDSLKVDLVVIQNTCSEKEDNNSENASSKLVKECSLNSEIKDVHAIKYKMSKAKERCMTYFRSFHSHLQVLSKDDLKGTRIEHGFKLAFMSLFGQDVITFQRTMLPNQMTETYFVEYTGIEVQHFRYTLLQHLGNVKKSVAERTRHQRQYERRDKLTVQVTAAGQGRIQMCDADISPFMMKEPMGERSKTIEQTTSFLANNADLKAQIQEKGFAIAALKNGLRKLKGNSVDTKNSSKNMPRFSSNDMVRNHYLDEARKNTQERDRNSKPSVMPSARFQSTDDGTKPKPRSTNHSTRSLPIFTGHRFSPNKTSVVYEKTSPRSDLRWKPTGRIFNTISLRWVPTGKILASCTSKDDSEPTHGSKVRYPSYS